LDVLHGVLVHVGVGIEGTKILDDWFGAVLLFHKEHRAVISTLGGLNDPEPEPLLHLVLKIVVMGLRDLGTA